MSETKILHISDLHLKSSTDNYPYYYTPKDIHKFLTKEVDLNTITHLVVTGDYSYRKDDKYLQVVYKEFARHCLIHILKEYPHLTILLGVGNHDNIDIMKQVFTNLNRNILICKDGTNLITSTNLNLYITHCPTLDKYQKVSCLFYDGHPVKDIDYINHYGSMLIHKNMKEVKNLFIEENQNNILHINGHLHYTNFKTKDYKKQLPIEVNIAPCSYILTDTPSEDTFLNHKQELSIMVLAYNVYTHTSDSSEVLIESRIFKNRDLSK